MSSVYSTIRHAEWASLLQAFEFGDGGAFFDIPVAQPRTRCLRAAPGAPGARAVPPNLAALAFPTHSSSSTNSTTASSTALVVNSSSVGPSQVPAPVGSKLMLVQTADSQLRRKEFSAAELERPDADATERERQLTADALNALAEKRAADARATYGVPAAPQVTRVVTLQTHTGQTRAAAIVEAARDPLDPKRNKIIKKQRSEVDDPAPLIRSPTRKPLVAAAAGLDAFPVGHDPLKLPGVVRQWSNPQGRIIPLEVRERVDGASGRAVPLATTHGLAAAALRAAEKELEAEAAARAESAAQLADERQKAEYERIQKLALEAVQQRTEEHKRPTESRDERLARRQEERDMRERVRDERQKQHRIERTARQLGLDVDEVAENEVLRKQILDAAPVDEHGQLDPRLVHAKGARAGRGTEEAAHHHAGRTAGEEGDSEHLYEGSALRGASVLARDVDIKAVRAEMDRQAQRDAMEGARSGGPMSALVDQGEGDDDDDAFGLDDVLPRK